MAEEYHIPVMLEEALEALAIKPKGVYVDATLGGGGHSRAIVERLSADGHLYSFDQDIEAISRAFSDSRFTAVHGNFRFLSNFLRYYRVEGVDGILADLGVSSHHFDDASRGFSFRSDSPLDMRMNQRGNMTARTIVNEADVDRLTTIFKTYGELRHARKIAEAIVRSRGKKEIITTGDLLEAVSPLINPRQEKKELAQVFQALRIEVNGEMEALEEFLRQALRVLKPGGRLVVITYHSLEDRIVKNFMRSGRVDGEIVKDFYGKTETPFEIGKSKPVVPGQAEIDRNPRSRSAKMRVAVKKED